MQVHKVWLSIACNRAIRHGQAQPLYLCTSRFLQIPEECVVADHRCLVPNADRKPAAATYPILGWDGPHWVPVWILATPLQVAVSKCEKAVFRDALRPDLPWVLNYTVLSVPSKGHLQFTGLPGGERGR